MDTRPAIPETLPTSLQASIASSLVARTTLAWLPASEVPPPYHGLLVHDHDMTSELGGFYRASINLTVLHSRQSNGFYFREVTLHAATTGLPVEYGLIEIVLDAFPAALRPRILAGDTPLGTILNTSGLAYRSEPQGFFAIPADTLMSIFPQSPADAVLYGRYNHLICGENTCLARILEILPPAGSL